LDAQAADLVRQQQALTKKATKVVQIDLDNDGTADVEVAPDNSIRVINCAYTGPPELAQTVVSLIDETRNELCGTKVAMDNISSIVSILIKKVHPLTFTGRQKKCIVLAVVQNLATTEATSAAEAQLNCQFINRGGSLLIDTLCDIAKTGITTAIRQGVPAAIVAMEKEAVKDVVNIIEQQPTTCGCFG
jgi:hypothetical protein